MTSSADSFACHPIARTLFLSWQVASLSLELAKVLATDVGRLVCPADYAMIRPMMRLLVI